MLLFTLFVSSTYGNTKTASKFVVIEIKTLLKRKIGKKLNDSKRILVDIYVNAPNPYLIPWTNEDKDALNALRVKKIGLSDTAFAVSTNQMAKRIKNKLRF